MAEKQPILFGRKLRDLRVLEMEASVSRTRLAADEERLRHEAELADAYAEVERLQGFLLDLRHTLGVSDFKLDDLPKVRASIQRAIVESGVDVDALNARLAPLRDQLEVCLDRLVTPDIEPIDRHLALLELRSTLAKI